MFYESSQHQVELYGFEDAKDVNIAFAELALDTERNFNRVQIQLLEQKCAVLEGTSYGVVTEGVGQKIKEVLSAIWEKIKSIFSKFFSWLSGSSSSADKQAKEIDKQVTKTLQDKGKSKSQLPAIIADTDKEFRGFTYDNALTKTNLIKIVDDELGKVLEKASEIGGENAVKEVFARAEKAAKTGALNLLGVKYTSDESFSKDLKRGFRDGKDEPYAIQLKGNYSYESSLNAKQIAKSAETTVKKIYSEMKRTYDYEIREIDKYTKTSSTSIVTQDQLDASDMAKYIMEVCKRTLQIYNQISQAQLQAIADFVNQSLAIVKFCAFAVGATKNKQLPSSTSGSNTGVAVVNNSADLLYDEDYNLYDF